MFYANQLVRGDGPALLGCKRGEVDVTGHPTAEAQQDVPAKNTYLPGVDI